MEEWELAAREGVRDVIARYNACGDAGRMDELIELYAPDAVMDMGSGELIGREAIRAGFVEAGARFVAYAKAHATRRDLPVTRHFTSTIVIDVTSPTAASAASYFQNLMQHGLDHWGRYDDELGVVDGGWKILRRRVIVEGATPGGFGALTL